MSTVTLGKELILNLEAKLVEIGEKVNFEFTNSNLEQGSLVDYEGHNIVLNIFPSIDTGICATSVREFNKIAANLDGTKVICVSADLPFAQDRFCGVEGIKNVELVSVFRNKQSIKNLGLHIINGPLSGLSARAIIILNSIGEVVYVQLVPEIKQEPDYKAALDFLKSLL